MGEGAGAAAPTNSVAPVISGTTTVGQTLSTTNGTWANSPTSYTYQWKRDGSNISSATASTYVVVGADSGASITCAVTATNAAGSASATSNALSVTFDPYYLFGNSEAGFIFDFSNAATMFTERTGASATTPTTVGNAIGTLKDLSPNGHYFTAASAGASPTLRTTSTYNNAEFDGGDALSVSTASLYAAGATSFFAVVSGASQASSSFIFGEGSSSSNNPLYGLTAATGTGLGGNFSSFLRNNASTVVFDHASRPFGVAFDSTPHLVGFVDTGTEMRMYLDGVWVASRGYTRSATTMDRLALGALLRASMSNFYTGRIYAAVAVGRALTDAELTDLIPWMGAKAGLTLTLSGGVTQGAWTWYNDPRAIKAGSQLLIGAQNGNGKTVIDRYDTSGNRLGSVTLTGTTQVDDHDNPGIMVRASDSKILAFYSAHNATDEYYKGISTSANDASAFTSSNLDSQLGGSIYSYANPFQLTGEANTPIYLFYRSGGAYWTKSTDDGVTWSTGVQFITGTNSDRVYVKFAKNGTDRIDCLYSTGNPDEVVSASLYHAYYQGGTWHKTDGTVLGTTFDIANGSQVWDGSTAAGEGWNLDIQIDGSGNPHCLISVFPTSLAADHRYRYCKWSGSAWSAVEVCTAGAKLGSSQGYSGGATFDPDDVTKIFCSRETGDGIHQLWRYTTSDGGANWSGTQLTSGGVYPRFRPYVIRGQTSEPRLAYVEGAYPTYTSLTDVWIKLRSSS